MLNTYQTSFHKITLQCNSTFITGTGWYSERPGLSQSSLNIYRCTADETGMTRRMDLIVAPAAREGRQRRWKA